ncbi:hypothetical protein ACFQO7_18195 [Catellatospora aurea]|uniref:Winged helix DNA-binding domain-containing protein n=1 Tax=Catellatospora aurea TaxID=1337874 RepID=A0ABW2GWQ4_9ACTN
MVDDQELALARARGDRWLPETRPETVEDAGRFVDGVGCALLFPAANALAPSLYETVADEDAVAWADGMGEAESTVWTWKDTLPEAGLAWYGKFLFRRASLLSPDLLRALYTGPGEPDDHEDLDLPREAHEIARALLTGPLTSRALRELIGDRAAYERAMTDLQRRLLVTSAGVREQRAGWPASIVDLTCRRFDVGGGHDAPAAARRYLETAVEASPGQLARAYGWTAAVARSHLDALVAAGQARRRGNSYRSQGAPDVPQ